MHNFFECNLLLNRNGENGYPCLILLLGVKALSLLLSMMIPGVSAQWWRIQLTTQKTQVQSLDQEDSLEKEIAIHSSILAWKIPWTEEPGRLQSMGLQRIRHNLVTEHTMQDVSCIFHWFPLSMWRKITFIPSFWEFCHKIMFHFFNWFLCIYWDDHLTCWSFWQIFYLFNRFLSNQLKLLLNFTSLNSIQITIEILLKFLFQ